MKLELSAAVSGVACGILITLLVQIAFGDKGEAAAEQVRLEAIKAGVGEYYHNQLLEKRFRWIKQNTIHYHITPEQSLELDPDQKPL